MKFEITDNANRKNSGLSLLSSGLGGSETEQTLNDLRYTIIEITKQVRAEEEAKGFDKQAVMFVDKDPRKPLERVNPFGQVEIVARVNMAEMLKFIFKSLIDRSPRKKGRYVSEHVVFVNNVEVATNPQQFAKYLEGLDFLSRDEIRFVNLAPYARKLERDGNSRGQNGKKIKQRENKKKNRTNLGTGKVFLPNGTYYLTARAAQQKYGKNAFIQFSFVDGGTVHGGNENMLGGDRVYKKGTRKGKPYFYPSIVVKVIGSAIKSSAEASAPSEG